MHGNARCSEWYLLCVAWGHGQRSMLYILHIIWLHHPNARKDVESDFRQNGEREDIMSDFRNDFRILHILVHISFTDIISLLYLKDIRQMKCVNACTDLRKYMHSPLFFTNSMRCKLLFSAKRSEISEPEASIFLH